MVRALVPPRAHSRQATSRMRCSSSGSGCLGNDLSPSRQRELGYSNFIALVLQFDKEASQTRDYCVAKNATLRAARPDSSLRKERLFGVTIKLHHYRHFKAACSQPRMKRSRQIHLNEKS